VFTGWKRKAFLRVSSHNIYKDYISDGSVFLLLVIKIFFINGRYEMKLQEIMNRLTGISIPVFGISWNPPEPQVTIARRVITFLEDRRVLFIASEMETPDHCVKSILEIRQFLTNELASLDSSSELSSSLRAMRAACRKFLNIVGDERGEVIKYGGHSGHWASWVFNGAIGELRGVFGIHIARIAAHHGLDVEDELASILPYQDVQDGTF
jgi:hypothetical protein